MASQPAVEIRAKLRAQSLRFGEAPRVEVDCAGDSATDSTRENLPDEVTPGVIYRDVCVSWDVTAAPRSAREAAGGD